MPNLMLTTTGVLVKRCARRFLSRFLCHVETKSMHHSKKDAPRVLVNHSISRYFNAKIDLDSNKTKNDDDGEKDTVVSYEDADYKKVVLNRNSVDEPFIYEMSEEEIDKYFPNAKDKQQLKLLALEIDVLRQNGLDVPQTLTIGDILKILKATSKGSKMKIIRYLFINERKRYNEAERKAKHKEKYIQNITQLNEQATSGLEYGLGRNSMFLRLYNKTLFYPATKRLMDAYQFETPLVFDCGYQDHMTDLEIENCARQIILSYAINRADTHPHNLQICNLQRDSPLGKILLKGLPQIYDEDFPTAVYTESYLDLYNKNDLVYLTPHCRNKLTKYDPTKIYIIGAFVDKSNPREISSTTARREGIAMARLPLEDYVRWAPGSGKSLSMNIMMEILLTVKKTRRWDLAFQHIPRRKLLSDSERFEKRHIKSTKHQSVSEQILEEYAKKNFK